VAMTCRPLPSPEFRTRQQFEADGGNTGHPGRSCSIVLVDTLWERQWVARRVGDLWLGWRGGRLDVLERLA